MFSLVWFGLVSIFPGLVDLFDEGSLPPKRDSEEQVQPEVIINEGNTWYACL